MIYQSPAKINLFLRILSKRADGYHEIATLIQAINFFDILTFTPSNTDSFTCSDATLPLDNKNLVIKALDLFRKKTGKIFPVHIHLEKKIPSQAGLGGGSSNAATTLYALNDLIQKQYTNEELASWSSEIGSDIPFFFSEGTAYCHGRGEKIEDFCLNQKFTYDLYKPQAGLSTPEVYRRFKVKNIDLQPEEILKSFKENQPIYVNDLEESALTILSSLNDFKCHLSHYYQNVIMSGSGSAFFCVGDIPVKQNHYLGTFTSLKRSADSWY